MQETGTVGTAKWSGWVLLAAAAVLVAFMAMHPSVRSHELAEVVKYVAEVVVRNVAVHSTLMLAIVAAFLGLIGFAEAMGLGRPLVRAGLVLHGVGTVALLGAATINGLVVSGVCVQYAHATGPTLDEVRPVLVLCGTANHACDFIGIALLSAAVVLWSVELVRRPTGGASRVIGVVGIAAGVGPVVMAAAGHLPMSVHGFGAFVLVQAAWYFAVGVQMVRERV